MRNRSPLGSVPGTLGARLVAIGLLLGAGSLSAQTPGVGGGVDADSVGALPDGSPLSDLAVRFGARGEFGGDWTLFRPCDTSFQLTCRPGALPQLQPQVQFSLQSAGSVAERLFVDVDYDQTREFAGANRFQVYYQGQEDELLQRLEVGDVTFALPESRFLTSGVPVGNFGMLARGRVGNVELQTVFAQQQGTRRTREFRLTAGGAGAGVIYRDTLVLDDADYVRGQFFFLVDPAQIEGAPHLDVLSLRPEDAPAAIAPGNAPIQLYRMERDPVLRQQVEGYIQADAVVERDGESVSESGWFRYLRPGEDYHVHSSGLWVALRVPLRPGDALAVAYISRNGRRIGDYDPEVQHNLGEVPTLRLIRSTDPRHQPDRPTWDSEMKQVYRVSGSDEVDPYSLDVSISLGEESGGRVFRTAPDGETHSFLRLFGMDEQSPGERVDRAAIFQPADALIEETGIQGTFLVFPTLRPFFEPPPVPSAGLSAEENEALLTPDLNRRIYEAPDPFERSTGGLYRLNLSAEIRSSGVTSVFPVGAFGLREGSERIYLGERLLQPFVDYIMDPQSGVVTLLQPEALLARSSSDVLRVSWEEPDLFQVAPTSVVGLNARLPVADWGRLDLIGLYQIQRELVNRPRFGAEPGSLGMVGLRSEVDVGLPSLDRAIEAVFGDRVAPTSRLSMEGELALALPNPNRSGDAFIDDFDAGDERTISLLSNAWQLGSAAQSRLGAEDELPSTLDAFTATPLAWQHTWVQRGFSGDSIGIFEGYQPQEIDRQINVRGTQTREPGLRLTFGDPSGGSFPESRWRSITTVLSPTGTDLTYTEFLDFYVAAGDSMTLVIDLGTVSEDAFFLSETGATAGLHPVTGEPWGLGVLDQEADPLQGEVWSPVSDERGLWVEDCLAEPGRVYDLGSSRANCTSGNGRRDTEDLNGNGVLDTAERALRWVIRLDGNSPYLARDRGETGTQFRLYRIPLRGAGALTPAGEFSEADRRAVQFLRVTAAGSRPSSVTLARMRLVGSRWAKRGVEGVLTGIGGDTLALGGELEVSPVSEITEGGAYQAPPGVLEELDDPASAVSGRGIEFNERSLGLRYRDLGGGDRIEVYNRFLQRPRNFLEYGELRIWAVAREGDWGVGTATDFFVKVGSDAENFYLYRSRLEPAPDPNRVLREDWLPERILEFDEWTQLRRRAERELAEMDRPPGAPPVVVWSADSTYAVVLKDRARAPNLAAVREISIGVWNRGEFPVAGEVWVNELRLGGGIRTPGSARYLNLAVDGGDLVEARLDYSGQGPHFRQLEEAPSYQGDDEVALSGTMYLGRMLPRSWGWDLPVSVAHRWTDRDPLFLEGTDLRAGELPGSRTPGYQETRFSVALRPGEGVRDEASDPLLPGLDASVTVVRTKGTTLTTESRGASATGVLGYTWRPDPRTVSVLPDFLEPIARILIPGVFLDRLRETRLRWNPEEVVFRTGIHNTDLTVDRFEELIVEPGVGPTGSVSAPEAWLENRARLGLRPFQGLGASLDMVTRRDLLDPREGVRDPRVRGVVERERRRFLGTEVGWETRREIVGRLTFQPRLPAWARADFGLQTRYTGERDPGLVRFGSEPDSVPSLLRNAGGERDLRASLTFDPGALVAELVDSQPAPGGIVRDVAETFGRIISPMTVSVQDGVTSRYYREDVDPGAGFQLGLVSVGRYRSVDQVAATRLVDRTALSAGSGLQLPASFFVNVNYQHSEVDALDRRSDRESVQSTWPDVRLGVGRLPLPEPLARRLPRISASAGLQRTSQDVGYGGGTVQRRLRKDLRIPVEVTFEWASGVVARYRGQLGWGTGRDPTGETERDLFEHGFSIETRLAPRGGLADRITEPLRVSLVLEYVENAECRVVRGQVACVDFIDQLNRGASFTLDTRMSGVEVGVQASLVDRRSYTGLQTGYTQFQVGLWGRMVFESGPVGRLGTRSEPF